MFGLVVDDPYLTVQVLSTPESHIIIIIMASQAFFLVGDEPSTARGIVVDPKWKLEELKRAVGLAHHIAVPTGMSTNPFPVLQFTNSH